MVKCIIADDEMLSLELLESYLQKIDNYRVIAKCKNGVEVFNILKSERADLLFLDIQMPLLTGIELAKSLKELPPVIFTTAFREYAVDSYELNAIDYLLKPVSFDRFLKAIHKFESTRVPIGGSSFQSSEPVAAPANPFIYVKSGKKTVKIHLKDILFIEGAKEFVKIKTTFGEVMTYQTLQDFERRLPDSVFLRIHRSYIIAIEHIRAYSATHVQVEDIELPIGHSYQRMVASVLKN
ncbi:LytR/AlgR family response regulator transcription factor [Chryseosolibacter indicus]|uniref:LytTR family DNA-binding domain-containing protein n=1 Tax=Chryseosolibacter indicus TaxID=2782351 RepID=A0ABS5VYW7_9BACT|nr:LytTR family DNA-binding domain-containing protein [Chryseosolibacter indicus]MBT1706521.1 LytTR family DNA-binding domain-containing protein [Chryseosolibacter indicus]